jgi:hypothetical protein
LTWRARRGTGRPRPTAPPIRRLVMKTPLPSPERYASLALQVSNRQWTGVLFCSACRDGPFRRTPPRWRCTSARCASACLAGGRPAADCPAGRPRGSPRAAIDDARRPAANRGDPGARDTLGASAVHRPPSPARREAFMVTRCRSSAPTRSGILLRQRPGDEGMMISRAGPDGSCGDRLVRPVPEG